MKDYKTEMHCHTLESSFCGRVTAEDMVMAYVSAGYDTLVIMDHYGFRHRGKFADADETERFLKGFKAAKKAAGKSINIILGMEISLEQNPANDYLVYGDVESFVLKYPDMYYNTLPEFCELAHANGLVVYQAHPFRDEIVTITPAPLDGIEVFNAHPRHDSRNDIARAWAEHFGKKMISGSDAHQPQDVARSGIITKTEIKSAEDIISVLASEAYELIIPAE